MADDPASDDTVGDGAVGDGAVGEDIAGASTTSEDAADAEPKSESTPEEPVDEEPADVEPSTAAEPSATIGRDRKPHLRGGALVGFSLRRPVTVTTTMLAMLVLGAIAYLDIPVELVPSGFTPPFLYVEVPTLRSAPTDVEERVAIPIEERLATVRNVETLGTRIRSNRAAFFMELREGTDMDVAYNQVRDRVDRVLPTLDEGLERYFVWKYNPSDEPVMWFAVTFNSETNASWWIENLVVPKLDRVPGVSRVEVYGAPYRVVSVEVDDRRAEAAGPGLVGLIQRMQADNFALSAGVIEEGGRRLPLRLMARYGSLDEIEELPIGNGLELQDVSTVEVQDRSERAVYRVNQEPSVFLAVYKESTANTVEVGTSVRQTIDEDLRADPRLEGFDYAFFFDQGKVIEGSIDHLEQTALSGGFFAIIILFYFLRRGSLTILITLAIPASLLVTIVVMYFTGRSLNVLSLTGLMLSVGMVVDNSIVVVESIQGRLLVGDSPRVAAYKGASEVALAIIVATLTTVVVFLPLMLMSGSETISFYLSQIGMPVCVGLIASLFVSLMLLPLAAALWLKPLPPKKVALVQWIQNVYEAALRRVVRRRFEAAALCAIIFASIFYVMPQVARTDSSEPNINDFRVFLTMPDEYSWSEQVDVLLDFERSLWDSREELCIDNLLVRMGGQWGRPQLRAFLCEPSEREIEREEIVERALELLPEHPGVTNSLDWSSQGSSASDAYVVRIVGRDSRVLSSLAEEAARRLRVVEGVTSVRTESGDDGGREMHFVVDRDKALRFGLSAWSVGGAIDFALRGRELDAFRSGDEELPILVQGDVAEVDEASELEQLELPGAVDDIVLRDVSETVITTGYGSIDRENRRTVVSITVLSMREDVERLGADIDSVLEGMVWPRGYNRELGGRFSDLASDQSQQNTAVWLAIICVFLLMGVLFESIVLPFSILLSIPFAFVGVYWALYLTGTPFDMMAGVGVIILIGIVVNNAIVLVDRIGELRRDGYAREEAIALAGQQRLRPIVMTAMTTIFGLIPMALGTSSLVGIPYSPLGRSVIGGLLASTLLTLFVVPLIYTMLDDARNWLMRGAYTLVSRTGRQAGDP